jgi:hypothetical protein
MTKAELISIFKDYRDAFPMWSVEHDVVLARAVGPVKQFIAFEDLSSGDYRPSNRIEVEGPPDGGQLLFQFLDYPYRQVRPREHAAKWPLVVKAMEEQFLPPVREPLGLARVLQLSEEQIAREGIENSVYFSTLAALSVYLGDLDRALRWCDRSSSRLASLGREPADWELRLGSFNQQLRASIQTGRAREFLQERAHHTPL